MPMCIYTDAQSATAADVSTTDQLVSVANWVWGGGIHWGVGLGLCPLPRKFFQSFI